MKVSLEGLKTLLSGSVIELKFIRRIPKEGWPANRRMLCTRDFNLLKSDAGRKILHFKPPSNPPLYIPEQYGLVTVWDIFWQDFRNIPADAVDVIAVIKTVPDQTQFWEYFDKVLSKMSPQQKIGFMKV